MPWHQEQEIRLNLGLETVPRSNLSSEGREQAVRIGKAFRSRNIRIARVLSSQWCRCLDTARLMSLVGLKPFVRSTPSSMPPIEAGQTAEVRRFI